jgi:hypothetical protein
MARWMDGWTHLKRFDASLLFIGFFWLSHLWTFLHLGTTNWWRSKSFKEVVSCRPTPCTTILVNSIIIFSLLDQSTQGRYEEAEFQLLRTMDKDQNTKLEVLQISPMAVFPPFKLLPIKNVFQGHNKTIQRLYMPLFPDCCSQSRIHFAFNTMLLGWLSCITNRVFD